MKERNLMTTKYSRLAKEQNLQYTTKIQNNKLDKMLVNSKTQFYSKMLVVSILFGEETFT